ncbi:MAG: hypothetical protein R6U96_05320 [Promethearchaeia archaeon]
MVSNLHFEIEDFEIKKMEQKGVKYIELPSLTEEEKRIVDPIVAPTSGLRIELCDILKDGNKYIARKRRLFLFFRVFRAIAQHYKENNPEGDPNILIVSDDRPTSDVLLKFSSQIFAYEGYNIFFQNENESNSKMSSPYGAASVALYDNINLVIVLTASHNELAWHGIKFYIEYPIPISGDLFKSISNRALEYDKVLLKTDVASQLIEAEDKNNDYIRDLLSHILEIKSLRKKDIIVWPYLGKGRGLVNLLEQYGANVHLIEENLNPPNPLKNLPEEKLQTEINKYDTDIALLLDADRDRIALYVKQNGEYMTYIPNEIYSALHNILAKDFNVKVLNVRTVPSDLRADDSSFLNVFTGVGYKHLGVILYFLFGIEVDQSKIDTAILYMEGKENELIQIDNPEPLKSKVMEKARELNIEREDIIVVMWEESGGHTINILNLEKENSTYKFKSEFPLIADKYPIPALVLITELISRGYVISESIDWSIVGINRTLPAKDEEKVKIMTSFEENDGKNLIIDGKKYYITALSDNTSKTDIYRLKSEDSTLYFRPSGTGPYVRFYIFGDRETYNEEIETVINYVEENYK